MLKKLVLVTVSSLALAFPCEAFAADAVGQEPIQKWITSTDEGNFAIGIDKQEKRSGASSAYIESLTGKRKDFGNLMQSFVATKYLGKRLRMTAWVKSKLTDGTAQLWVRVDGNWDSEKGKRGCFDNMDDRPIRGQTDWTQYSLVVDVPKTSSKIWIGLMLVGAGKVWLDDVAVEPVGKDVPLTGAYTGSKQYGIKQPLNLDFEGKE